MNNDHSKCFIFSRLNVKTDLQTLLCAYVESVKEARRSRTHFTKFKTDIIIEAFEKNRFPGIVTREKLAQQTGIPESMIHVRCASLCLWQPKCPYHKPLFSRAVDGQSQATHGCPCALDTGCKYLVFPATVWRNSHIRPAES